MVRLGKASENPAVVVVWTIASKNGYEILAIRLLYLYSESGVRALRHQEAMYSICDKICKKGSSTHTTLAHRFHYHTVHYQTIHVCMYFGRQQFTSVLLLMLHSEACQITTNAWLVFRCLCCLFNKGYRAERFHAIWHYLQIWPLFGPFQAPVYKSIIQV